MRKKLLRDKKGFTLVELIVVLVILAILIALLVPALTGYIDKARKKTKIAECRLVVEAAQTCLSEMYGAAEGTELADLSTSLNQADTINAILNLAEVPGELKGSIIVGEKAVIAQLLYVATDGTEVNYKKDHEPQYWIEDGNAKYSSDAPGYLQWVSDQKLDSYDVAAFLDEEGNIKKEYEKYFRNGINGNIQHLSKRLQAAYQEKYGGFPAVDWSQIDLQGIQDSNKLGEAVWKPIVTQDNKQILVADKKGGTGNAQAAVIYYDGKYYYHKHSEASPNKVSYGFVDDIKFTIDDLLKEDGEWAPVK